MSLSRENLIDLMALADGELEGDERARVEKLAAGSDEARHVVEAMQGSVLGDWLDEMNAGKLAAADGIAEAVMAKIAADATGQTGGQGVVRLADARAKRSKAPLYFGMGVGVLAVAAAIALYARSGDAPDVPQAPVASVTPPPPAPTAQPVVAPEPTSSALNEVAQQAANAGLGVEVDEIDSPAHDVTVFEIPGVGVAAAAGQAAPSSVVIMISDEPGKP
ncbi:MAG TPA: hypothetical protein VGG39_01210 [Polyangiaceae bacterium]|jgi:anti-sigma factor RsiW